mmetsp:Transcript_46355/g.145406  ORF Transcript_46355/g.145406 Transcript_46355/m.145406 type:complete len:563 (-) Transcript_46355:145-1833(-)
MRICGQLWGLLLSLLLLLLAVLACNSDGGSTPVIASRPLRVGWGVKRRSLMRLRGGKAKQSDEDAVEPSEEDWDESEETEDDGSHPSEQDTAIDSDDEESEPERQGSGNVFEATSRRRSSKKQAQDASAPAKKRRRGRRGGKYAQRARAKRAERPLPPQLVEKIEEAASILSEARRNPLEDVKEWGDDSDEVFQHLQARHDDFSKYTRFTLFQIRKNLTEDVSPDFAARLFGMRHRPLNLDQSYFNFSGLHFDCSPLPLSPDTRRVSPDNFTASFLPCTRRNDTRLNLFLEGDYLLRTDWMNPLEIDATCTVRAVAQKNVRLWGNWLLRDDSEGKFVSFAFLHEALGEECSPDPRVRMFPMSSDEVMFRVEGVWSWNYCTLRSVKGDAMQVMSLAEVSLYVCTVGGLGGNNFCGQNAVLMKHRSKVAMGNCTIEFTGYCSGGGVAVFDRSHLVVKNSTFRANNYAISVLNNRSKIEVQHCLMTFNFFCFRTKQFPVDVRLTNTMTLGPVWMTDERPEGLVFDDSGDWCHDYLRGVCKRHTCRHRHDLSWARPLPQPVMLFPE